MIDLFVLQLAGVEATTIINGVIVGIAFGLLGYYKNRDEGEPFKPKKLTRTVVIFAAAGVVVSIGGDPLTKGNVVAATGMTGILGKVVDELYGLLSRGWREAQA